MKFAERILNLFRWGVEIGSGQAAASHVKSLVNRGAGATRRKNQAHEKDRSFTEKKGLDYLSRYASHEHSIDEGIARLGRW